MLMQWKSAGLSRVDARLAEISGGMAACKAGPGTAADIERAVRELAAEMDISVLGNPVLKSIFERFVVYGDGRVQAVFRAAKDGEAGLEILIAVASKT